MQVKSFRTGRKFGRRNMFVSWDERDWCNSKFLDPHMLREVELLAREVWIRIMNMGIIS